MNGSWMGLTDLTLKNWLLSNRKWRSWIWSVSSQRILVNDTSSVQRDSCTHLNNFERVKSICQNWIKLGTPNWNGKILKETSTVHLLVPNKSYRFWLEKWEVADLLGCYQLVLPFAQEDDEDKKREERVEERPLQERTDWLLCMILYNWYYLFLLTGELVVLLVIAVIVVLVVDLFKMVIAAALALVACFRILPISKQRCFVQIAVVCHAPWRFTNPWAMIPKIILAMSSEKQQILLSGLEHEFYVSIYWE